MRFDRRIAWLLIVFLVAVSGLQGQSAPVPVADRYKPAADKIIAAALNDNDGYKDLTYLCDHIGNRIAGSDALNHAIQWAAQTMKDKGLANVTTQPVSVPYWIRGHESASLVAPFNRNLHILGLGKSVATPAGGITAEIVAVSSFDELVALGADRVKGKIVVYNEPWKDYGDASQYRTRGASRASALGAVAVLVRSATGLALAQPHTGTLFYDANAPKIPAAALTVEDAGLLARLYAEGAPVKVHLELENRLVDSVPSANVVGELVGSEHPEQVVVLGGHIDSWDVGQGAQDDGSGILASLEAVAILKKLGLQPRRTIRVVFWTNEESGASGAAAYRKAIGDEIKNHVAAIEMDTGAEAPTGIGYGKMGRGANLAIPAAPDPRSVAYVNQIAGLLASIGVTGYVPGGGGTDVEPLTNEGVPGLRPVNVNTHYFDWHHSEADTIDKVDLNDFRKNIATLAVLSYILADTPEVLAGSKE